MKLIRQFVLPVLLILIPIGLGYLALSVPGNFCFLECSCDWRLTAAAWEDTNANGIREDNEPSLDSIAIAAVFTFGNNLSGPAFVQGTDQKGQVVLLHPGIGICPRQVKVAAYAPAGYIPTTSGQVSVKSQLTTNLSFGFRKTADFTSIVYSTDSARCRYYSFRYSGKVTGVVSSPNGDIWITSQSNGGVTLKKDGKDYPQDIPYFGSYAEDIAVAPDGSLWVAGGLNAGVAHLVGTTWKTYTTEYGALPSNDVRHVAVTSDGHVWALTSAGLADFNPVSGRWRNQSVLGSGFLLLTSTDGMVWLVDNRTLTRFQSQSPRDTVQRIPINFDSASFVDIWNAATGSDGSIWLVGNADGWPMIAHYTPSSERWTTYTYITTRGSMPLDTPNSIGILSDGSALVSLEKLGAIRLVLGSNPDHAQWMVYPDLIQHMAGVPGNSISILSVLSDNSVWFSDYFQGDVIRCSLSE